MTRTPLPEPDRAYRGHQLCTLALAVSALALALRPVATATPTRAGGSEG